MTDLRIDWATYQAAKYACFKWHYSGSMPVSKMVRIGVWEDGIFKGVVLFSGGPSPKLYVHIKKLFGIERTEACELTRIALADHKTPVSRIIRFAFKFLKRACPGIRLVVSYADLDQNHHGGIYQASNWVYDGLKNPGSVTAFIINGRKRHRRSVGAMPISRTNIYEVREKIDPNATVFISKGKHRYWMPLDDEMKQKVEPLRQPYPKRDKQAMNVSSVTAAVQHRPSRSNIKDNSYGKTRHEATAY